MPDPTPTQLWTPSSLSRRRLEVRVVPTSSIVPYWSGLTGQGIGVMDVRISPQPLRGPCRSWTSYENAVFREIAGWCQITGLPGSLSFDNNSSSLERDCYHLGEKSVTEDVSASARLSLSTFRNAVDTCNPSPLYKKQLNLNSNQTGIGNEISEVPIINVDRSMGLIKVRNL